MHADFAIDVFQPEALWYRPHPLCRLFDEIFGHCWLTLFQQLTQLHELPFPFAHLKSVFWTSIGVLYESLALRSCIQPPEKVIFLIIEVVRPWLFFGPVAVELFLWAALDVKFLSCSVIVGDHDAGFVAVDG